MEVQTNNPESAQPQTVEKSPIEVAFEQIESLDLNDDGEFVVTEKPVENPSASPETPAPPQEASSEKKEEEVVPVDRFKGMQAEVTRKANEINELKQANQILQNQMAQLVQTIQMSQMPRADNPQQTIDAADIFSDINKAVPFIAEIIKEVNKRTITNDIQSLGQRVEKMTPDVKFINQAVEANKLADANPDFKEKIPAMKILIKEYAETGKELSIPEAYQQLKIAEKALGAGVSREAVVKGNGAAPSGITPNEVQSRINAAKTVRGSASPSVTPKLEIKSPKDAILAAIAGMGE